MEELPLIGSSDISPNDTDLQLRPPPSHDELDRLLFHIPLEDFGKRLQLAAEAVFPNNTESRYESVYVLLLCWEDGDPKLPVEQELEDLKHVFDEGYHFQTETWKIPSKNSHRALSKKITEFVEIEDDSRDCLKIVYYGGHGFLSPSRQLMWSNVPDGEPRYQQVKWHAIQATLEDAESDVLLLLDCCAAGTASTDDGHGVTELIGACAFNVVANGVGDYSFTTALSKELRAFRKIPSFTVGRLYNNLLRRVQMSLSHMTIQKAPIHVVLTQDDKLPRSIQLSPLQRRLEGPVSTMLVLRSGSRSEPGADRYLHSNSSSASDEDADPFSQQSGSSSITSLSSESKLYPRIVLSVQLPGNTRPDQLNEELFKDWLRMIPVIADNVTVEAGWGSFSTLLIVSVPMLIWRYISGHPAVKMVGIIRSPNLLKSKSTPISHPEYVLPSMVSIEAGLSNDFKTGVNAVERWFSGLGKKKQREVLFRLHDVRVTKKLYPHRFNSMFYDANNASESASDDWGPETESETNDEDSSQESRHRRLRSRSHDRYSEPAGDFESAIVRFQEQPARHRRCSRRSTRDSAYGSVTSGSRSSRSHQRSMSLSSISSFDESKRRRRPRSRTRTSQGSLSHQKRSNEQKGVQPTINSEPLLWPDGRETTASGPQMTPPFLRATSPPSPPPSKSNSYDLPRTDQAANLFADDPVPLDYGTGLSHSPAALQALSSPTCTNNEGRTTPEPFSLRDGDSVDHKPESDSSLNPNEISNLRSNREHLKVQFDDSVIDHGPDEQVKRRTPCITVSMPTPEGQSPPQMKTDMTWKDKTGLESEEPTPTIPEMQTPYESTLRMESQYGRVYAKHTESDEHSNSESASSPSHNQERPRIVSPQRERSEDKAVKGILRQPREKFPEDPNPIREGVAPLKDNKKDRIPPDARWTKISRKLVNPEALEAGKERFEAREDFVIVLRVLSREEVQQYAVATAQIREQRLEEDEDRKPIRREKSERLSRDRVGAFRRGEQQRSRSNDGDS
ncbi:hypothetical protein BP6252_13551 [Coleophoma cylindrospora]|uniref:DUF8035 domain-containing protein n=1 Tax=Coleophoma cylindrospora TaxID=1849047 RepID=A0A3D8Q8Z6_9HELO|nr:hypothetical protein BP6252_13551 [Coleophoma cylindrospora]